MANEDKTVQDNEKTGFSHVIAVVAIFCLIVFSIFSIISQQAEIAQLEKESQELSAQITEEEQKNDEYNRLLSAGDEAEYMERVAVEQLGYAYPNERRYYIVEVDE